MELTAHEIGIIVNPALDRIAAGHMSVESQNNVRAQAARLHYPQTRKSVLRSFVWPFATRRANLHRIYTMTLHDAPQPEHFEAGDTITGADSDETATILSVLRQDGTQYEIVDQSGDFDDGEVLTDGDNSIDCDEGFPVVEMNTPSHKWTYEYALPDDGLRLVDVYQDDNTGYPSDRWEIEGKKLLTYYDTVDVQYVKDVIDPTQFDDLFAELLILRLAMKLVNPLAGTSAEAFKAEMREELRTIEYKAACVADQENNTTGRFNWALARYGVYG